MRPGPRVEVDMDIEVEVGSLGVEEVGPANRRKEDENIVLLVRFREQKVFAQGL